MEVEEGGRGRGGCKISLAKVGFQSLAEDGERLCSPEFSGNLAPPPVGQEGGEPQPAGQIAVEMGVLGVQ